MRSLPFRPTLLVVLAALGSAGCDVISFAITTDLPATTISAGAPGDVLTSLGSTTNIDPQNTGPAGSASLQSLTLSASGGGTFDFIQEVHFYIDSPGLPEVEVANLTAIPAGQTSLSLNVLPNIELLPYLQAGCTLRTSVTGTAPAQDFVFTGELVAEIGV
jgi:hypothetical protein